jgi:uncharacterized membrane protein
MRSEQHDATTERVNFFSDGIFAIIITIMILELKRPPHPTLAALAHEWPTWISYIVSYTFIAIVWINHHYLLQHAVAATLRLIWVNFAHVFTVSLIPFFTDWIAESKLSATPVAMYAFVFLLVNITYLCLIWQTMYVPKTSTVPGQLRKLLHRRSVFTITLFATAMIVASWLPYVAFGIICCCLILYLRPDLRSKKMNTK